MEENKKYCKYCGEIIDQSCVVCPKCGKQVEVITGNNQIQTQKTTNGLGVAGMVIGIIALVTLCCGGLGGFLGIIGIILSIVAVCSKNKPKGNAVAGIVLNMIAVFIMIILFAVSGTLDNENESNNSTNETVNSQSQNNSKTNTQNDVEETKDKYYVGDTWQNKYIKVTYTDCYEFTDYNQYNAPADGNKIICAEFEFENIGNSDSTVMYTDFHGYADGYEVNQSYAPDGTGLDFTVKMSAGRKGTGKVAFEVPENSSEIEIEFSPNMWTSENIVFVFE